MKDYSLSTGWHRGAGRKRALVPSAQVSQRVLNIGVLSTFDFAFLKRRWQKKKFDDEAIIKAVKLGAQNVMKHFTPAPPLGGAVVSRCNAEPPCR